MKRANLVRISILGLVLLAAMPMVSAAEFFMPSSGALADFPPSQWWLVAHDQCADTLHWINTSGEYVSIPRPVMPNEAATPECSSRSMHISQNGRYFVQSASLNSGRTGVGFYDLATGQWLGIYQAEAQEFAVIGGRYSSTAGNQIAIGFAINSRDAANRGWRVALFDMVTGTLTDEIRSDGPELAAFVGSELFAERYAIPYVNLFRDAGAGSASIDFALRFRDGQPGVAEAVALTWHPAGAPGVAQELISGLYEAQDIDVLPNGAAIYSYEDPNYPFGQPVGTPPAVIENNAIAILQPTPANPFPQAQPFFADGVSTVFGSRWGADGRVIIFRRNDGVSQQTHWLKMGTSVLIPLAQDARQVYGVPTGFVYNTQTGIFYQGENDPAPVAPIFQPAASGGRLAFVWATPYGSPPLELMTVANASASGANLPQFVTATANVATQQALPTSAPAVATEDLTTGPCRLRSADNTKINIRSGPGTNYDVIGQLPAGSELPVIGYYADWYAVNYAGSQGWMASWVTNLLGNCAGLPLLAAPPSPVPPTDTPAPAPGSASINFYIASTDGGCSTLAWEVSNVQSVYFEGAGVAGTGSQDVCPLLPTTYTLTVNKLDGTTENRTLLVAGSLPPLTPGPTIVFPTLIPPMTMVPLAFPDLYVSEFSLTPGTPVRGEAVEVRVGVYNQGSANATDSFTVRWWPGENYASSACSWTVNGLVAGGGRILTCTYGGYPSTYGSINTKVMVDSGTAILESNEANNVYLEAISVVAP